MALFGRPRSPGPAQQAIPSTRAIDSTFALLAEGYRFITRRCDLFESDVFSTRLMLRKAICVRGEEAARMFYQPGRFTRRHAIPPTTLMLLQDYGSAQLLDGEAHRKRKAMLMSLQGPAERQRLVDLFEADWRARFSRWQQLPAVVLHREAEAALCRVACRWAGVPVSEADLARRTAEFSAMIDGAGSAGPRNWKALLKRRATERWASALIDAVRDSHAEPPPQSALAVIAWHREADGQLISRGDAAVELINTLRPTVAVARFIVFGALALHEFPEYRPRVAEGSDDWLTMFAQEVRRYYPFFPTVGGRASHAFDWRGLHVEKGAWVLLDLYGTDHHPALWSDPDNFRPERFERWQSSGYDLVAQGGGDFFQGHRCAGEMATVGLLKTALRLLATAIEYRVPPQDLRVSLSRMPTLPASGFVIDSVRVAPGLPATAASQPQAPQP
jgi:fatty-acid peroxygenase